MVQINFAQKSVSVKVVYYGPGMSGKTTNLEIVHQRAPDTSRGDLTSISTDGDRTLFFDFMPLDLGTVAGMHTQFQIYTVPGQVYYNSTRKLVLQGVDGVIFIADSGANMMEENLESLRNLEENLAEYGKDIADMPLVIQWNKRDMPDALPVEELEAKLNKWGAPTFEAVASSGQGVFPTLKALAARVLESIHDRQGGAAPASAPTATAPAPAPAAPAPMQAQGMPAPMPAAPMGQPEPATAMGAPTPPAFPTPTPMGGPTGAPAAPAPFPSPAPMGGPQPMGQPVGQPMGQPMPMPAAPMGTGALPNAMPPAPAAPAPSTGGLSMGSPLPLPGAQPAAPATPANLSQTGIQPMYQPTQAAAPAPMGQPVAPQVPSFGAPPAPAAPTAPMGHAPQTPAGQMMGAPGQAAAAPTAPRPVQQSTRLKPRSQPVKVMPAKTGSGKGKWVFLGVLVLAAAGAGAAYFMGYITI